jgi:hypothetical protein
MDSIIVQLGFSSCITPGGISSVGHPLGPATQACRACNTSNAVLMTHYTLPLLS